MVNLGNDSIGLFLALTRGRDAKNTVYRLRPLTIDWTLKYISHGIYKDQRSTTRKEEQLNVNAL